MRTTTAMLRALSAAPSNVFGPKPRYHGTMWIKRWFVRLITTNDTWVDVGGKVAFGVCLLLVASVNGFSGHLGGDARADEDEPPGPIEEVVVVGEPIEEELTWLDHMEIREWLAGAVGEIREQIELEMGRVTLCGDEGCALAPLLDWLIASIEDDVSEMDDCIRDRLSARDRENSSPHRFEYEIGATPEARYDPSTNTYITLLDPLDVNNGSSSNLYEWVTHELTHHITYDPETGSGTEDHGEDFWDKYYAIRGATTSCRGG